MRPLEKAMFKHFKRLCSEWHQNGISQVDKDATTTNFSKTKITCRLTTVVRNLTFFARAIQLTRHCIKVRFKKLYDSDDEILYKFIIDLTLFF